MKNYIVIDGKQINLSYETVKELKEKLLKEEKLETKRRFRSYFRLYKIK